MAKFLKTRQFIPVIIFPSKVIFNRPEGFSIFRNQNSKCLKLYMTRDIPADMFKLKSESLTCEQFMSLHEMALEDEDGGEEEITETLASMGYNEGLVLVKAIPWHLDVFSEKQIQLKVAGLVALTANHILERSVVRCIEEHGTVLQEVVGKCQLLLQTLPWKSTAAIKNIVSYQIKGKSTNLGK